MIFSAELNYVEWTINNPVKLKKIYITRSAMKICLFQEQQVSGKQEKVVTERQFWQPEARLPQN